MSNFIFNNNGKAVVVDLDAHVGKDVRPAAMEITSAGWSGDASYYTYLFITRFQYKRQTGVSVQTALNGDIHFTSFSPAPTTLQVSGIMVRPTSGASDGGGRSNKGFEYLHEIANQNLMESSKPTSHDIVQIGVENNMTLTCLLVGLTANYKHGKVSANVYNFTMSLFVLGSS